MPDIAAVADTDAPTYYYDDDYGDYGDYYYEQPAPEDYGYVDHQHMPTPPPQYQQPPEYYNYAQHQQPPPPPQTQQPPSIYAPFPSSSPAPGASSSPPSQLHLLMAQSVPQGESELNPVFGRVGFAGLALASQPPREAVGGRTVGSVGSELWVSDNGATDHITNDPTNVYDWEAIPPGKEKVLIGGGKEMRVMGVGSLNLTMHSTTDLNVKLTQVYVTEGIWFNLFSLHNVQARQTITLDKNGAHLFDKRLTFPRNATGSCLYATRMDPTPTIGLTVVPALSSDPSVVPWVFNLPPPSLTRQSPNPKPLLR